MKYAHIDSEDAHAQMAMTGRYRTRDKFKLLEYVLNSLSSGAVWISPQSCTTLVLFDHLMNAPPHSSERVPKVKHECAQPIRSPTRSHRNGEPPPLGRWLMHSHSSGDWSTVRDQPGPKDPGLQYKKAMAGW
ncbi:hypothetical protein PCASD_12030 [Puccinia coronata f. sp. avenae]|uniref:Uncharacterized protein n=1 Tax=Puccinia coronata f. sp. avenae TaxID=200324 RepID=A0A2N5TBR6_9BASI|nr:hypothetical protein PCASD_12030 [Puccinia coronata f. sp. avenae]